MVAHLCCRTNRRRIDRRQQRVALVNELFAEEIRKIDPNFLIRRKESALFPEDTAHGVKLFDGGGITDREYHLRYPTIHHLILELMTSWEPHDVRLVYLACAWLVAHRGHFLFDFGADQTDRLLDFGAVYGGFRDHLQEQGDTLPWSDTVSADTVLEILQMDAGVGRKKEAFKTRIFGGKKPAKECTEDFPYSPEGIVGLLSGGKVKPKDLFDKEAYEQMESVSLDMGDEVTGLDSSFKSGLRSYHIFKRLLGSRILTEAQVEEIILHAAYTEDKSRMGRWLRSTFPQLTDGA